ncbi:hypothetical protein EKO23_01835 [Nocardioides guangzhouensis]|uniref:Sel1 repeat family protein n=1 Tax=Nocardioides guangzhouensis TaxID=2497878 RepID=A0A4Q4ZL43_9ACTN|nr:bifunctional trypsin-like peptidase domain-containing/SEL1-like repeat protein [Nocardioides guangzhouensis]RYP88655.1 hypothetical protein EKO23_01835 [Nocardioides guangzhouensis]
MNLAIGRLTESRLPETGPRHEQHDEGATAFAVAPTAGLTAFHCVGDRHSNRLLRPEVDITFRSGVVKARVEDWNADLDIALLTFVGALPAGEEPVPLSDEFARSAYYVRGYPYEAGGVEAAFGGTIVDVDARPFPGPQPAIQLHSDQAGASHPLALGGFSGAPVLVDDPPRAVGLIRWNPPAEVDERFAKGAIVYATPMTAILRTWSATQLGVTVLRPSLLGHKANADSLLRLRTDPAAHLPSAGELNPADLGALPTRYTKAATDPYVPREADELIAGALQRDRFVLLLGPATSGKSRTAAQVLVETLPQAGVLWPKARPQGLRRLLELDLAQPLYPGPIVVWLDALEQYLSEDGGLDAESFGLLSNRVGGAFLVATMTLRSFEECLHAQDDRGRIARALLDEGPLVEIELPREITPKERAAAMAAYPAEDWTDSATGIAERLIAARELLNRLRTGRETEPTGWLAVRALIDWARATGDWITEPIWRLLLEEWRRESRGAAAGAADFDAALAWAQTPVASSVSLLVTSDEDVIRGRRFGVLDYVGENYEAQTPVADATYRVAISELSRLDDLSNLLLTSVVRDGRDDIGSLIVPKIKEAGDHLLTVLRPGSPLPDLPGALFWAEWLTRETGAEALRKMGRTAASMEQPEDAVKWLRPAAEAGDIAAMTDLGVALEQAGETAAAQSWTLRAAEAGDTHAMLNMGARLFADGRQDEARRWAERAARAGNTSAMLRASWLAVQDRRTADAVKWARQAAEGGHADGMFTLASLLAEGNASEEAVQWWRRAGAEHGHIPSIRALLAATRDPAGNPAADAEVGEFLWETGHRDQAEEVWQAAAEAGDSTSAYRLGVKRLEGGDTEEALPLLARASEEGHPGAFDLYGYLLLRRGDTDGAIEHWTKAAATGDGQAAFRLYEAYASGGHYERARASLERAAELGFLPAVTLLDHVDANEDPDRDPR